MKIYRPDGKLWREVVALDSSFCEETLERFNRISLDFVLAEEVLVPELCYVTWRGERYSLFSTPKVVKVSTREYRYTLNLEGRHLELDRVLVKDKLGRTKFVFTGRADQYAELISDCLPSWKVGACTTGDATRVIAFNNTSLLEACRMVASKFETEVQLTDGAISFGRVERYKSDPLLLAYRNGLKKDITVEPDPKETAIGRLYVVGGDRNIDPAKYGSHQLRLPKGGKVSVGGRTFVADAEGRYISLEGDTRLNTSERAFDASSIYPKRVGTVSKVEQVGDEWDVLDDANTIDYGQHRVGGDTMRLEFQSGRLAGRTFDLATKEDKLVGYVPSEKRFKLVRKEIDGVLMPEPTTFYPAVGDKYAIFGCSLPDEYITSAEGEMLLRGAEYMAERLEPRLQYRAELDGLWAKKNWGTVAHKLVVGTIVRLEGASSEVRISSVRTSLNSPYTPRITFSNAPYMVGSLATQIATLENAEVRQREELRAGLVKLQDRTYKDTEAVREMVEKLKMEGFSKALKPETLQTMYAVIGSPALQFEFVGGGFRWIEGKGGAVTIPRQTIRQRVAGTTLEPEPKTVGTTIPALTYTLKPDEQQAHIYVELKPTPRYIVSTKPLQITPDRLLVGLLNGTEGSRDFTPLYGFTEISPSHIATRYIRSRSGNMLIDLETGNIYSDKIEFRRPDGSTKSVEEVITDTVQVGGRNLAVMSRMVPGYIQGSSNAGNPGDVDYKVRQYYPYNYDPTYYPIEEGAKLVYVIKRIVNPERNVHAIIHWHNENKEFIGWDNANWRHLNGTPHVLTAPKGTHYYRFGISDYPKRIQVKLERGTVATDWSPAPEDVQASIENEAKAREAGDKAQADSTQTLQQALDALRESGANDNATLTDLINKANQRLDNLQEQADGEVSNWFYPGAPAQDKAPENEWTTNGIKARHIGDTYTSTDEGGQFMGKSWRYTTEFKWQEIHDTLVSQALAQASKAQTTADGKSTTFLVKPTKYEDGDTWVMESSQVLNGISYEAGTMLFAKQGSSAFVESHWVDKVRYIGATQLKESEEASKRAWKAYANAQAEAERVKAEAHADGIVTAEEQARINATNKALESAKAYAEAQDALLEQRQKAYADGVLTEAERRAINVAEKKAKLAETNAKAYSDGVLTEAEKKAIAQAQKAYDDAVKRAEELDRQLQVDGLNLIKKGDNGYWEGEYRAMQGGAFIYTVNVHTECIYQVEIRAISEECVGAKVYWQWSGRRQGKPVELTKEWQRLVSPIVPKPRAIGLCYIGTSGTVDLRHIKAERYIVATVIEDIQADIETVERGYQKLIERVDVEFAISNSRNTAPTSGWVTKAPTPARGQALWQRTKVYLKDGTAEVRGVTCIQGKDGLDGADGGDGADGRGISKIVELYYLSSSNTALANGAWTETAPTPKEGFWIWTKTHIHYTTGEQIDTQPICVTGNKGDRGERGLQGLQGKDGTNGLPGRDGVDGKTSYTHIAYADTVTGGGFSQSPAGKAYIGMYVDFVQTDSTNPKKYAWSLIKGADGKNGLNGKDGVPGKPGVDGRTPYLHIAYANSQDGKQGFSVSVSEGKSYIGTYTDYTQADSTDPTKYGWSRIKGDKGDKGDDGKDVDPKLLEEIQTGLTNANTAVDTLQKAQKQLEKGVLTKADTKDIQYLLDSLKNGKTQVAGGLVLTNNIILSDPNSKDVTAMISGSQTDGAKAMRLGINYTCDPDKKTTVSGANAKWGVNLYAEVQAIKDPDDSKRIAKLNELGFAIVGGRSLDWTRWEVCKRADLKEAGEATAFNNSGTGHIGELFFNGDYIGFGDSINSYMQVGGKARAESDMLNASTEIVTELMGTADANKSGRFGIRRLHSTTGFRDVTLDLYLNLEAKARAARSEYRDDTGNLRPTDPKNPSGRYDDNAVFYESRRVTMRATIEVLQTRVDGVVVKTLKSEQVSVQAIAPGGSGEDLTRSPERLFGESELNKKVQFVIQSKDLRKGDVLEVFLVTERVGDNDYGCEGRASAKLVATYPEDTSKPEVRITQDKTSFFYGRSRYMLLNYDNLIAKIVGDVLMQGNLTVKGTITADSYQGNGMPLAGATFDSSGREVRGLGRYKNKSSYSYASAAYSYSTKSFTVYHSIPHDRYIPLVNAFNDPASPVVSDVSAYSFKVRFTLQSERYNGWAVGFSYIAFQAE